MTATGAGATILLHSTVIDSMAYEPTMQKLTSFAQLPDGWHFGQGRHAEPLTVNYAKAINRIALAKGWSTDAFPGISGEIMLSVENSEHYYEVVIGIDGILTLVEEVNDEEVQRKEIGLSDMVETLSPNSSSCFTFDLSTPHIGSNLSGASQVWLSRTPAQNLGEEFRLSNKTVLKSEAEPFARMWAAITKSNTPSRLSSGESIPEPCLRIA